MNEGRSGIGQPGIGQGPHTNPTIAPTLRPAGTGGIGLRPQPAATSPGAHPPGNHSPGAHAPAVHAPPVPVRPAIEEPLELEGDDRPASNEAPKSKIHQISAGPSLAVHSYKRPTHYNKTGAVRMRTFHCRLSEQGVEYLDQTVNDWLEHHPDIEVKFTTSTIGLWDGKLKEPTLIINVWY